MLKKSADFKGYIFIESLVSLIILVVVIGSYLNVNSFLLGKTTAYTKQLTMIRILYEEVKHYENDSGLSNRKVFRENKEYLVTIIEQDHQVIKAVIENGKDQFAIESR